MNLGQQLALTRPWWMWKSTVIQAALRTAKLRHALPVIDEVLRKNRQAGCGPTSMRDLAGRHFLSRNPRNMERIEDGTYALTDKHLIGLSVLLKIPLDQLVPPTPVWIAFAARELCATITEKEARAYSLYRVECLIDSFSTGADLDESVTKKIAGATNGEFANAKEVAEAIAKAADALGKRLEGLKGKDE